MTFLNIGFLYFFPYFDVRVLTTALYLCAYLLQLGAQLICWILSLKLDYFSFDILSSLFCFFTLYKPICDFMLFLFYSVFCTNRNEPTQVQYLRVVFFISVVFQLSSCSQGLHRHATLLQTLHSSLALHCIIICNQNCFRWFRKKHWMQLLNIRSTEVEPDLEPALRS